jgi:hypothetical protein
MFLPGIASAATRELMFDPYPVLVDLKELRPPHVGRSERGEKRVLIPPSSVFLLSGN